MIYGIGSGGIESLLANYRVLEERPIRDLESRRDRIDQRMQLLSDLKSKLKSLESLANEFSSTSITSVFSQKAVTVSDETYLTVTATASAVVTSHTVFVQQLAKADKVISNQYTLSGTDISSTLGAGTYTFDVTVNGDTYSVSVEIADGDDNETVLDKIVEAVNNTSDIGIRASVLNDSGTTGRLVFTSTETGADYEMTLSDTSGTLLSTIGMDDSTAMSGTSGGYLYDSSELNAVVIIDGVTVQSNSNTIEDALEGLTLNLLKAHQTGDEAETVNVTNDVEGIKNRIQDFIDAYNDVIEFIKTNTMVNTTTYERAALSGDYSITNLKMQLRSEMTTPVTGLTGDVATILAQIGITTDRDGKLSISDSDTLEEYLEGKLDEVEDLFASSDGYANRLLNLLDDYTDGEGIIEKRKDVLQNQITQINNRIDRMEDMVDKKIENYRIQFGRLQAAYSMYSAQYANMGTFLRSGFIIPQ